MVQPGVQPEGDRADLAPSPIAVAAPDGGACQGTDSIIIRGSARTQMVKKTMREVTVEAEMVVTVVTADIRGSVPVVTVMRK